MGVCGICEGCRANMGVGVSGASVVLWSTFSRGLGVQLSFITLLFLGAAVLRHIP